MRAGAAHADRVPGLPDRHAGRTHRDAELQHRGTVGRILIDGAGHEQVRGRRSAGEDLARIDPVAAVDLARPCRSRRASPSRRRTGAECARRDSLEQAFDRRASGCASARRPRQAHGCASRARAQSSCNGAPASAASRKVRYASARRRQAPRDGELEKSALTQQREIGTDELIDFVAAAVLFGQAAVRFRRSRCANWSQRASSRH